MKNKIAQSKIKKLFNVPGIKRKSLLFGIPANHQIRQDRGTCSAIPYHFLSSQERKGQSEILGFILLTLIVISVVSISFFWALPQVNKINNVNEVQRIENRMLALHNAIKDVANERSQRTVDFEMNKGEVYLSGNRKITYSANLELPDDLISSSKYLIGNSTVIDSAQGPCYNTSIFGRLGKDEPACLLEKGSIEIELEYLNMNDTSNNDCYGIWLEAGNNALISEGSHTIQITFKETNTTDIGNCENSTRQIITISMR